MFKMIAVTNRALCIGDFLERIDALCRGGFDEIILREKDLNFSEYEALARDVKAAINGRSRLVLHTQIEACASVGVDRLHLNFADFVKFVADKKVEKSCKISVSIHSLHEAIFCDTHGASAIIYGHIFNTPCKIAKPRGIANLALICECVRAKIYAIGGINSANFKIPLSVGASGVCVMSGAMSGVIGEKFSF